MMKLPQRFVPVGFVSAAILLTGLFLVHRAFLYAQDGQSYNTPRPHRIIETEEPEWRINVPVQALVNESRIIAVGVPLRNQCRQAQNGQVTTDYQVRLQEVIKGNVQPEAVISVKMPGGLVTEADGTLLEARARRVRKMQNGKTYILFVKNAPGQGDSYTPLRGSQGLYEIPLNGNRVIHLGRSFDLPPANDGELVSVFLQQIRALVH